MGNLYIVAVFLSWLVKVQGDDGTWSSTETMEFRPEKGVLASVRESPLFFHKCSATFLTPRALLTTASCLKCAGDCDLSVAIHDHVSVDDYPAVMTYQVESVVLHPGYEVDRENNNIGLIRLVEPVENSQVFRLPDIESQPADISATIFKWHFNKEFMDFSLQSHDVRVISNNMCYLYLYQFVSYQKICIHSYRAPMLGAFDYGTPIIAYYRGMNMILGMFVETGSIRDATVVAYQSIIPHVTWIQSVLLHMKV